MKRTSAYAWYVVALLATCNFLGYALRNVLFSAYEDLRAQYAATDSEIGLLATVYMAAHALATLPAGWLGDRVDRRHMLALAVVLWTLGAFVATIAPNLLVLGAGRALTGLATAAVVPVANAILSEIFPQAKKAAVLAVFNLGLFLGGTGGLALGALGHPAGSLVLAIPGLIAAVLVARLDVPPRGAAADASPGARELARQFAALFRIRTLRWLMVSTTAMAFAAGGYQAWLLDFLQQDKGMTKEAAIQLLAFAFVGGLAGVVAGGRIADRLRRRWAFGRLATISIGMACTVPCALTCIYSGPGVVLAIGSVGTMFFISWYHGPMAASVDDLAPTGRASTTQALVIFTMHLVGTAPASWLVGQIKQASSFTNAMLVPTAAVVVASLAMTRAFSSFARDSRAITDADA